MEGWKPRRIPKEGARKRQPHRREKEEKRVEWREREEEEGKEGEGENVRKRLVETPSFLEGILKRPLVLFVGLTSETTGK